ncbi:MAG: aldehyde dehydrogenase [Conexibacter sp.]|nr:aldehyde dehydrogenase [Conexibacter sp.]
MAVAKAEPTTLRTSGFRHYVAGAWVEPEGAELVPVVNPATEDVIARVPRATVPEAERAIGAARNAFDDGPWPRMSPKERSVVIRQLADGLRRRRDDIADILVQQGGCTITQARGMQCHLPIEWVSELADIAEADTQIASATFGGGPWPGPPTGFGTNLVVREPVGVVSAITPFNYPFLLNLQKVAPALAAGCCVVLKPTAYTCLDAVVIAEILDAETDLPPGVFNLLLGGLGDVGELLASHPSVDAVSFTGSTAVGQKVMAAAAPTVKRVMLELGGKSPNIVLDDADLDKIEDGGLVIRHCGQGCGHWTRVLVHESRHDELVELMCRRAAEVRVGDPSDPSTVMGPLASADQLRRVEEYVQAGVDAGATLVAGGGRPPDRQRGYFFEPTIFTDVRNDMRICQEEIFGPVVTVQAFGDDEEAIRIANDSVYGLNGAVWTRDLARGLRIAARLRTGTVVVNGRGSGRQAPYGGYKQSGIGREFGVWGYHEFHELKAINFTA